MLVIPSNHRDERPEPSEELRQITALWSQLRNLDRQGQERVARAEAEAADLLAALEAEIASLEKAAEATLTYRLQKEEALIRENNEATIKTITENCARERARLQEIYLVRKDHWINEIVRRTLEGEIDV